MRVDKRLLAFSVFALILALGWSCKPLEAAFIRGYCTTTNLVLRHVTYGGKVKAVLRPAPKDFGRRPEDQVATDTFLDLRASGYAGFYRAGVNLRRDVYLPWLLYMALVSAAPLALELRVRKLALGSGVIAIAALLSSLALVEWLVTTQAATVYTPTTWTRRLTEFVMERWLTPPGNRVIAPLLLAAAAVLPVWFENRSALSSPAPDKAAQP